MLSYVVEIINYDNDLNMQRWGSLGRKMLHYFEGKLHNSHIYLKTNKKALPIYNESAFEDSGFKLNQ